MKEKNPKQEKELEGLTEEERGEKLREILAECARTRGYRSDDDAGVGEWYDPNYDIGEEDLMAFGNGW